MKKKILLVVVMFSSMFYNCASYLDVVPEGVSTLESAFSMRDEAERYLFTCYSYMPRLGDVDQDPGLWGDEVWTKYKPGRPEFISQCFDISMNLQNAKSPLIDRWDHYYRALRDCNIFLENIATVPDLPGWELEQWVAEVKVLKAYYHFILFQMYGPIPIIRENLPVTADENTVRVPRNSVDECVGYMVELIDEAKDVLLMKVVSTKKDLGRITSPIAYSLKAKILVTAASPLYNGNTDQATLKNRDGTALFNQTFSTEKWDDAVTACEDAIAKCTEGGITMYQYQTSSKYNLTDTINKQMELRLITTDRKSSEIIWANTQSRIRRLQEVTQPRFVHFNVVILKQVIGMPIKIAEQFYTSNGVPIEEDKSYTKNLYGLRTGDSVNRRYIRYGIETINANFDREPRFYAWVGFDGGIWYGQGKQDDKDPIDLHYYQGLAKQPQGAELPDDGPVTGYLPKKFVHYESYEPAKDQYSVVEYAWPIMRLADLYLLYAECLNEVGRSDEAITYVDKIRNRAGLLGVKESWDRFAYNKTYETKEGLKKIIKRERKIELAFEGQRYWDIRRWKDALNEYKTPIQGWDLNQRKKADYYRKRTLFQQQFGVKDYFWPIRNENITRNSNLVQNMGW